MATDHVLYDEQTGLEMEFQAMPNGNHKQIIRKRFTLKGMFVKVLIGVATATLAAMLTPWLRLT